MAKDKLNTKVTLFSGKVVVLRELRVRHQEQAAQIAASQSDGNHTLLQLKMNKELLKLLIVSIDGKTPKPIELEDLDNLFSFKEAAQLYHVLNQLAGSEDLGKYQIEHVNS